MSHLCSSSSVGFSSRLEYKSLRSLAPCWLSHLTSPPSPAHESSSKHTGPLLFLKHTRNAPASRKLAILSPSIVPPPDIFKPCSHTSFKYLISRTSNTVNKIAFHPLPPHAVYPPHPALFSSLLLGTLLHLFFVYEFIVYCTSVEAKISEFPV